jgi:hypothetical protein
MEGWCEMRKDEYFSQMLLEMRKDENCFAFDFNKRCEAPAVVTVPEVDANDEKNDEWMIHFSKEDLQSVVDAVRYPHESTSHLKEVSLSRTMLFAFVFVFAFSPMVLKIFIKT